MQRELEIHINWDDEEFDLDMDAIKAAIGAAHRPIESKDDEINDLVEQTFQDLGIVDIILSGDQAIAFVRLLANRTGQDPDLAQKRLYDAVFSGELPIHHKEN